MTFFVQHWGLHFVCQYIKAMYEYCLIYVQPITSGQCSGLKKISSHYAYGIVAYDMSLTYILGMYRLVQSGIEARGPDPFMKFLRRCQLV